MFKEKVALRNKQIQLLERQGIFNYGAADSQEEIYTPAHLYPTKPLNSSLCALAAEIPDDILRAKESDTAVPPTRFNYYTNPPTQIELQKSFKLIKDPLEYEMEYKRRNVWSYHDMKVFLVSLLKGPKRFEKIGEVLPHKTSKEIVFFYHTFKKLLRLKSEIKNARELIKIKNNQQPHDIIFTKQADIILEPLTQHMRRFKFEI